MTSQTLCLLLITDMMALSSSTNTTLDIHSTRNSLLVLVLLLQKRNVCWLAVVLHLVIKYHDTVKPRYNEPLYNEVLGKTNDFINLDITKPRYSELILLVPWPFVISRFHRS